MLGSPAMVGIGAFIVGLPPWFRGGFLLKLGPFWGLRLIGFAPAFREAGRSARRERASSASKFKLTQYPPPTRLYQ